MEVNDKIVKFIQENIKKGDEEKLYKYHFLFLPKQYKLIKFLISKKILIILYNIINNT